MKCCKILKNCKKIIIRKKFKNIFKFFRRVTVLTGHASIRIFYCRILEPSSRILTNVMQRSFVLQRTFHVPNSGNDARQIEHDAGRDSSELFSATINHSENRFDDLQRARNQQNQNDRRIRLFLNYLDR